MRRHKIEYLSLEGVGWCGETCTGKKRRCCLAQTYSLPLSSMLRMIKKTNSFYVYFTTSPNGISACISFACLFLFLESLSPVFHVWMEPLPGAHTAQQPRCSTRAPWKGHAPQCVFGFVFYINLIRRALLLWGLAPTGICFLEMESSTIAWGERFVFAPWNVVSHSVTSKQW